MASEDLVFEALGESLEVIYLGSLSAPVPSTGLATDASPLLAIAAPPTQTTPRDGTGTWRGKVCRGRVTLFRQMQSNQPTRLTLTPNTHKSLKTCVNIDDF